MVLFMAMSVSAAKNETIDTFLNVTGNRPNTTIEVNEAGDSGDELVSLNENATQLISCWGTADDLDGLNDLQDLQAWLFAESSFRDDADNRSVHYTNTTCDLSTLTVDGAWNCTFNVPYYAENSTWTCAVNISDKGGVYNDTINDTVVFEDLLSLDVHNTTLDFGTKAVNVNDSSTSYEVLVHNLGNVQIDLQVDAYEANATVDGTEIQSDSAFNCSVGQIPVNYLAFNTTETVNNYATATHLSGPGLSPIVQFDLDHREDDGSPGFLYPTNRSSFWGVGVPDGVAGTCHGRIIYVGVPSS